MIGEFKNGGREWRRAGEPGEVKVHDFMEPELGKAIPYGVYDLSENQGWVSVREAFEIVQRNASSQARHRGHLLSVQPSGRRTVRSCELLRRCRG